MLSCTNTDPASQTSHPLESKFLEDPHSLCKDLPEPKAMFKKTARSSHVGIDCSHYLHVARPYYTSKTPCRESGRHLKHPKSVIRGIHSGAQGSGSSLARNAEKKGDQANPHREAELSHLPRASRHHSSVDLLREHEGFKIPPLKSQPCQTV